MGLQVGLGTAVTITQQTTSAANIQKYGRILGQGYDDTNVAVNVYVSQLWRSAKDLSAYLSIAKIAQTYLNTALASAKNIKSQLTEMKQLALMAQNASAIDTVLIQGIFASKQATVASLLADANFSGTALFATASYNKSFAVGNKITVSASLDSFAGTALIADPAIAGGGSSITGTSNGTSAGSTNGAATTISNMIVQICGIAGVSANGGGTAGTSAGAINSTAASAGVVTLNVGTVAVIYTSNTTVATGVVSTSNHVVIGDGTTNTAITFGALSNAVLQYSDSTVNFAVATSSTSVPIENGSFTLTPNLGIAGTTNVVTCEYGTGASQSVAAQYGAIGIINNETGYITTAGATINTNANAVIAANLVEASLNQVEQVITDIGNYSNALTGISNNMMDNMQSLTDAAEALSAADITQAMAEISSSQQKISYVTAVWQGERNTEKDTLRAFQHAVGG